MVLATAITGYGAIGRYFSPNPYTSESVLWAEAMLATSMITNVIVTALTAGRIWQLTRGLTLGSSSVHYNHVLLLIIESGLVMSISKTIEFILFELAPDDGLDGLNALYILMDCMPQIMGICPTAIILAVNRGFSSTGYVTSSAPRSVPLRPIIFSPAQKTETSALAVSTETETTHSAYPHGFQYEKKQGSEV